MLANLKKYGLLAHGKSNLLARKVSIVETDPKFWTKEDFELILPDLSIHQDLRSGSLYRVESIMSKGLNHGMVDILLNMVTGQSWTFGHCFSGTPAYIFVKGLLKYKSNSNPYLSAGIKQLFVIFPSELGADILSTINLTAIMNDY